MTHILHLELTRAANPGCEGNYNLLEVAISKQAVAGRPPDNLRESHRRQMAPRVADASTMGAAVWPLLFQVEQKVEPDGMAPIANRPAAASNF